MPPMKVLVCGGRGYDHRDHVFDVLSELDTFSRIVHVVTGGARGADTLAQQWAREHAVPYTTYMADWQAHGKAAGPLRNQRMLDENPDVKMVVAFPGGRGTNDMMARARRVGILVMEVPYEDVDERDSE